MTFYFWKFLYTLYIFFYNILVKKCHICFTYCLDLDLDLNNVEMIKEVLLHANVVGGLATQKKGAIDVVPSIDEIEQFIKQTQKGAVKKPKG